MGKVSSRGGPPGRHPCSKGGGGWQCDASVDMCFDCASPDARPRGGALGIRIRKLLLMCECVCMCVCVRACGCGCVWCYFYLKSMMLVDWVVTRSMDSRRGLGTDFGATAIWSEIACTCFTAFLSISHASQHFSAWVLGQGGFYYCAPQKLYSLASKTSFKIRFKISFKSNRKS